MSQKQHRAAFLDGAGKPLRVGTLDTKKPGPGEILVRTVAVAMNPVDYKVQDSGQFFENWPVILGADVAGEVVEVGEGVTDPISVGSRVAFLTHFMRYKTNEYGGFQELVLSPASSAFVVPEDLSYEEAVGIPLAISTTAAAFFQPGITLGLDMSGLQQQPPKRNGKTLLIWGGSSSVGSMATQVAVAAGYDVVTTASPRNFAVVKELGARAAFDYNDPSVLDNIVAEFHKEGGGEFAGVLDAIGTRESQLVTAEAVKKLGTKERQTVFTVVIPMDDPPEGVTIKNFWAIDIFHKLPEIGKTIFKEFLPRALKSGQIKPFPPPKVVGEGLDAVQLGLDRLKAGVSATKVVVTL